MTNAVIITHVPAHGTRHRAWGISPRIGGIGLRGMLDVLSHGLAPQKHPFPLFSHGDGVSEHLVHQSCAALVYGHVAHPGDEMAIEQVCIDFRHAKKHLGITYPPLVGPPGILKARASLPVGVSFVHGVE